MVCLRKLNVCFYFVSVFVLNIKNYLNLKKKFVKFFYVQSLFKHNSSLIDGKNIQILILYETKTNKIFIRNT